MIWPTLRQDAAHSRRGKAEPLCCPVAEQVTALFERRWRSTVGLVTLRRHMIPQNVIPQNDLGEVEGHVQVPCRERQVDRQPLDDAFAKFHSPATR